MAYDFLEHDGLLAFAHRGGASSWPENTMPAFQGAIDLGYRYIETDVHATRDGVLLAFHDDVLDRVTDMRGKINEMDYAEVSKARVAGREPIPLLEEILAAWPDVKVNIDPKADEAIKPLIDVLNKKGVVDRVCVTSFSNRRTRLIREDLGRRLCTGIGPWSVTRLKFSTFSGPAHRLWGGYDAGCAQLPVRQAGFELMVPALIDRAHEHGLQVHVWTIDDPEEMNRLIDLGVDGIMTDEPAILKAVLEKRGLWP